MAKIDEENLGKKEGEIRYLTPLNIDTNTKKKYCRLIGLQQQKDVVRVFLF